MRGQRWETPPSRARGPSLQTLRPARTPTATRRARPRRRAPALRGRELVRLGARGASQLERGDVVVRELLGEILRPVARKRLDPCAARTCFSARSARGICPYATSRTSRCVNANSVSPATELRRSRRTNSFRCSERSRSSASVGLERADPERLAEDGGVEEQALLLRWQRVESRGDDSLHRLGELAAAPRLARRTCARTARRRAGCRRRARAAPAASRPAAGRGRAGWRCSSAVSSSASGDERQRQRVALAPAPARPPVEQLGPRGRDHEERHVLDPVGELVDEVEQIVVGPVEVFEHEHRRAPLGERLDEAAPGGEALVARAARAPRGRRAAAAATPPTRVVVRGTAAATVSCSLRSASAAVSVSRIPACALTISPNAQNAPPSPYGSERPWRQCVSSGVALELAVQLARRGGSCRCPGRRRS